MNGKLYPDFSQRPTPEDPKFRFHILTPYEESSILGYRVIPVPVPHGVPAVGLQVSSHQATLFYTGDTGKGLASAWRWIHPDILIVEVTLSNEREEQAVEFGHMTPGILNKELTLFQKEKGYLPRVVTVHMHPAMERDIRRELAQVSRELEVEIVPGHEDLKLTI